MLLYLHPCTWTVSNSLTSIFLLIITTHWTHSDLASQRWSVWGTLCLGWSVAGVCVWLVQTLSWGMGLIVCWTRLTSHLFARTALRPLYLFFSLSAFFSQSSWRHDWGSVEFEPLCGFTSGLVVFGSCRYFGCGAFVGQLSGLWGYYNTSGTPNG